MLVLPLFFVNYLTMYATYDEYALINGVLGDIYASDYNMTGHRAGMNLIKVDMEPGYNRAGSRFIYTVFILNFLGHGMRKNDNKIIGR